VNCRNCRRQPVERRCEFGISRCRRKRVMTALSFCVRSIDRITSERGALYLYTWRWDRTGRRRNFRKDDHPIVACVRLGWRDEMNVGKPRGTAFQLTAVSVARLKSYAIWYHHTWRSRLHSRYCIISFIMEHPIRLIRKTRLYNAFPSTFYFRLFLIFQFACTDPIPCFSAPEQQSLFRS
jgi:hypothetical protein